MTQVSAFWRCDCGDVEFALATVKGTRCICYCEDCRAFLTHLGRQEITDQAGGTDLFQTTPDRLELSKGSDNLACLRLSKKGPLRWYTTCCNTPVCNTGAIRALPLATLLVRSFDDQNAVGPVIAHVNLKGATSRVEGATGSLGKFVRRFLGSALIALVSGRYRKTPFFNKDGKPVVKPKRLDGNELSDAYGG